MRSLSLWTSVEHKTRICVAQAQATAANCMKKQATKARKKDKGELRWHANLTESTPCRRLKRGRPGEGEEGRTHQVKSQPPEEDASGTEAAAIAAVGRGRPVERKLHMLDGRLGATREMFTRGRRRCS